MGSVYYLFVYVVIIWCYVDYENSLIFSQFM